MTRGRGVQRAHTLASVRSSKHEHTNRHVNMHQALAAVGKLVKSEQQWWALT
jgi:hypothetical protein